MMNETPGLLDILLRILASLVTGFIIGLERERRGRAAGLRTNMLVCVAACLAMLGAHLLYAQVDATLAGNSWRPDPNRVAQGVLAGMGFLGAGTILRQGTVIHGLTTAAGLWLVTVLGLTIGSGYFVLGGAGLAIAILILLIMTQIEKRIDNERYVTAVITLAMEGTQPLQIRQQIEAAGAQVVRMDFHYDLPQKQKTVSCDLRFRTTHYLDYSQAIVDKLLQQQGVQQIKWDLQN
jgi:putative Mg2+ transporter-C (MgtC) family protein